MDASAAGGAATRLADVSDADLRAEIEGVGIKTTRGAFIVNYALCDCAAYRMQAPSAHMECDLVCHSSDASS